MIPLLGPKFLGLLLGSDFTKRSEPTFPGRDRNLLLQQLNHFFDPPKDRKLCVGSNSKRECPAPRPNKLPIPPVYPRRISVFTSLATVNPEVLL